LAVRVAAIRGTASPGRLEAIVVVAAADHGVVVEGVSAYPQAVTRQMLANFERGGAAVCVLARRVGAQLCVVNAGVGNGTKNIAAGPAMTCDDALACVERGISLADELAGEGAGIVALGELGIANTTAAAAVVAALLGASPGDVCGRGTGLDDRGVARKVAVVRRALELNRVAGGAALDVLAALGGFEIAVLAGLALGGAANRLVLVLDGVTSSTAALVAACLAPGAAAYMVAGHLSPEPAHRLVLDELGLQPLLDLGMRLGEGTGAALALPLVDAAIAILEEMATFKTAGVFDAGR
jgi:nicotinate-nucleotide--dimethylbenzimidazole phosphoribosyltransferase